MIGTKTPFRISLVGGGTDLPEFYKKHGGAVVSFTINKYMYVFINPRFTDTFRIAYSEIEYADKPEQIRHDIVREALKHCGIDHGLEIVSLADIPGKGTGLGSSSSFAVGLMNALNQHMIKYEHDKQYFIDIAAEACKVEIEKCEKPIGKQDQYAAAYGGLNYIKFNQDDTVEVEPIHLPVDYLEEFERHFLFFYLGGSRDANEILTRQADRIYSGAVTYDMQTMAKMAGELKKAMEKQHSMSSIGQFLHSNWLLKKKLAKGISNEEIDEIYRKARKAGALGGKLCGAGGGGFIFLLANPALHQKIEEAVGLKRVPVKIDPFGTRLLCEDAKKDWLEEREAEEVERRR